MKFIYDDGGRSKYFKASGVGDCAVRAIAIATGIDYKEVYNDLKKLNGGKSCRNGTPKKVDKKYLTQLGWIWTPCMEIGSGCQTHLSSSELPSGTLIVAVSKHLTCVKDGVIYDTYDCSRGGDRCVYGYWRKPTQSEIKERKIMERAKDLEKQFKEKAKQEMKKVKDNYNKKIKDLEKQRDKKLKEITKKYASQLEQALLNMSN